MIPLGAKVVLTLAAVVFGFAVAIIKPRFDERQRQREIERAMLYAHRRHDSIERNSNVETENNTCIICFYCYNDEERRPLVLPCGHSFCQSCLGRLEALANKSCPNCRKSWSHKKVAELLSFYQLIS